MKTTLLTPETDENAVKTAAELIRAGEVVGMPTETVYGLAANALNGEAVKKIFLAKGRPQDNPLIVHIADFDQIYDLCPAVPPQAKLLADAFWPGPLTMIVPKGDCIPDEVSCGLDTVGIRLPSHPMARALIRESGVPLAAPSANTSGRPSTTTAAHVIHDMDGKIAAYTGASKWVTGETARRHVQQQRHRFRGIMVGVGTVLADDPLLTCRMENGRNPVRIICDTHLRTPPQAQVVITAEQIPTILATCCAAPERQAVYQRAGCQVLCLNEKNGHVDLRQLMERMGREQIDSILLEGGGTLNWAALECGIVQQVQTYIAPKLFGGRDAKTPVEGVGVPAPDDAFRLKNSRLEWMGEDLLIESEVEYPCSQES